MAITDLEWAPVPQSVLNIDITLSSGQCFRWNRTSEGEWLGSVRNTVVRLRPCGEGFLWQTYPAAGQWQLIHDYFALDIDLSRLQSEWIDGDARIKPVVEQFDGLRILRQEPNEVLFSFICACCNTITKITRSIKALEKRAGEPIADIGGNLYYSFPEPRAIAALNEADLRADLWGFRAPRLIEVASISNERGSDWLGSLQRKSYPEAQLELRSLPGVGEKIADCICAFGLGFDEAVPVDTHVRKAAEAITGVKAKSLTAKAYTEYANSMRAKFGRYAGWAQQYLFMQYMTAGRSNLRLLQNQD